MSKHNKYNPTPFELQILKEIRENTGDPMISVYREYRKGFIHWGSRNFRVSKEDVKDGFQDTMVIFYHNIVSGRLKELTAPMKSYIYAIGRNRLLKVAEKRQRFTWPENMEDVMIDNLDLTLFEKIEKDYRTKIISEALAKLGKKCQDILRLFYFNDFSMEAIAIQLGYSNSATARATKRRCIEKLRGQLPDDL